MNYQKLLGAQSIGWNPGHGVRLHTRPFRLAQDVGSAGAGLARVRVPRVEGLGERLMSLRPVAACQLSWGCPPLKGAAHGTDFGVPLRGVRARGENS